MLKSFMPTAESILDYMDDVALDTK